MSSHLPKLMVPAVFLSAVAVVLTVGLSAAQATIVGSGRGGSAGTLSLGHSGTSIGLVMASFVALALVAVGIVADRRLLTPAMAVAQPTPLRVVSSEAEQRRKAA